LNMDAFSITSRIIRQIGAEINSINPKNEITIAYRPNKIANSNNLKLFHPPDHHPVN
jgi:hypothetical protein